MAVRLNPDYYNKFNALRLIHTDIVSSILQKQGTGLTWACRIAGMVRYFFVLDFRNDDRFYSDLYEYVSIT